MNEDQAQVMIDLLVEISNKLTEIQNQISLTLTSAAFYHRVRKNCLRMFFNVSNFISL